MAALINLLEDTLDHFNEGAKSVRAYAPYDTYIITRGQQSDEFWVTVEEPGFPKTKTNSLNPYFEEVFGIEAKY